MSLPFAHVAGVPVEETIGALAPVLAVGFGALTAMVRGRRRSFARGHGSQLVKRLSDESREVSLVGLVDPAFERDPEDSDPRLGSQDEGHYFRDPSA